MCVREKTAKIRYLQGIYNLQNACFIDIIQDGKREEIVIMKRKKLYIIITLLVVLVLCLFGCKKKKHNWHEVGAPEVPKVEHFGVQTSKGTESNPVKVYVASIYVPTGRDENGKSQFQTIMYEMEELTPEGLNEALIDCGVLSEDVLFIDFTTEKAEKPLEMGPGAVGKKRDLSGTVRYVELDSLLENSDDYIDPKTNTYYTGKKAKGLIDFDDILYAVLTTFEENYQLADCGFVPGNMKDYQEAHNK